MPQANDIYTQHAQATEGDVSTLRRWIAQRWPSDEAAPAGPQRSSRLRAESLLAAGRLDEARDA